MPKSIYQVAGSHVSKTLNFPIWVSRFGRLHVFAFALEPHTQATFYFKSQILLGTSVDFVYEIHHAMV